MIKSYRKKGTKIEQTKVKKWTTEILEGLDFIHDKRVVHLDIKPKNIFLDEFDQIKVGDVGIARNIESISIGFKGTPCYVSPEMIAATTKITRKSDIWSFGCVVYEMIELKRLFNGSDLGLLYENIKKMNIQLPENIDKELENILTKYLFIYL